MVPAKRPEGGCGRWSTTSNSPVPPGARRSRSWHRGARGCCSSAGSGRRSFVSPLLALRRGSALLEIADLPCAERGQPPGSGLEADGDELEMEPLLHGLGFGEVVESNPQSGDSRGVSQYDLRLADAAAGHHLRLSAAAENPAAAAAPTQSGATQEDALLIILSARKSWTPASSR